MFNNPFRYTDPTGENLFGFFCGIGQILAGGVIMASGVALEVVTLGGYTFALGFHESAGLALMTSGCASKWNNVNIKNYTSFFHDGSIVDINHAGNKMIISMESAEIAEEDLKDDIILSENNRVKGKLHIEGIKDIKENDKPYFSIFKMKHKDAEIFHFEVNQNNVELQIKWNSYPPSPSIKDFSTIKIEAEKIWWENCPKFS